MRSQSSIDNFSLIMAGEWLSLCCSIKKATQDYSYRTIGYELYSIPANLHPKPAPIHNTRHTKT